MFFSTTGSLLLMFLSRGLAADFSAAFPGLGRLDGKGEPATPLAGLGGVYPAGRRAIPLSPASPSDRLELGQDLVEELRDRGQRRVAVEQVRHRAKQVPEQVARS